MRKSAHSSEHLQELLATQLYEGVLTDDGWSAALRTLSVVTKTPQISIIGFNTQQQQAAMHETYGMTKECLEAYNGHFHQMDETLAFRESMPWGSWYLDRRDLGEAAMKRSAFYQDFMARHDLSTILCNRLLATESTEAFLSFQRRPGQPHFTSQDLREFQQFLPHVQRSVRIRLHMRKLAERAGLASLVLDHLQIPLMVLDEQGRILLSNTQSDTLMRQQPRLVVQQGFLNPQGLRTNQFIHMLRTACGLDGAAIASGVRLADKPPYPSLDLLVLPLPVQLHTFNRWARPLALVILSSAVKAPFAQAHLLQQLYGLTLAEARVLLSLNQGSLPKQIAQQHSVSIGTVRTQIKAIFQKTGANRQSELIRLMAVMSMLGKDAH